MATLVTLGALGIAAIASWFVCAALWPHLRLARACLGRRVVPGRWRRMRVQLFLQAASMYLMSAMYLVLVLWGGPKNLSDGGLLSMVVCGTASILFCLASYFYALKSREA